MPGQIWGLPARRPLGFFIQMDFTKQEKKLKMPRTPEPGRGGGRGGGWCRAKRACQPARGRAGRDSLLTWGARGGGGVA